MFQRHQMLQERGKTLTTLQLRAKTALAVLALTAPPAFAGVIRHDRADIDYRNYANDPNFASVGRYSAGGLSGSHTLIAPQWALTAAHVVDINKDGKIDSVDDITNDRLTWGTTVRNVTEILVPTGVNGNPGWNGNINDGFDIALVKLDSPVTSIEPATLYGSFQELGKVITSVGFGATGTGTEGAYLSSGTKRAGDNVVDRFVTFANGITGLRWDFDEPAPRTSPNWSGSSTPLDMEYLIAPGDSGGGSFLFENDAWYLAGVHSGTYPSYAYPGANSDTSTYGDEALITRLSAYQQFIFGNIPDLAVAVPEPAGLAAVALVAIMGVRRRR
jgi:hypothetical protein